MALSIPPIGGAITSPLATRVQSVAAPSSGATSSATSATPSNGNQFTNMLDQLSNAQNQADVLAKQAATGDLSSIQALTMATTEAQLMTQLTVTIRNRALEAFKDIMGMQV